MIIETSAGVTLSATFISNYFKNLINQFFKILPLWESSEPTLPKYIRSLQIELLGYKELILSVKNDSQMLSLVAVLQYLLDNPATDITTVKSEVFKAISICSKLQTRYSNVERGD